MKNKKLILFDLDRTLLDNDYFTSAYKQTLDENFSIKREVIEDIRNKYHATLKNDRYYRPSKFIKQLSEATNVEEKLLTKFIFKNKDLIIAFPEVREALNRLKERYELGIWTEGLKKFQKSKVEYLEILHLINPKHIYIFPNKTSKLALGKIPKNAIIIDDKVFNIEKLLHHGEQTPIWLNRNSNEKHNKATTVHTLLEFEEILYQKYS